MFTYPLLLDFIVVVLCITTVILARKKESGEKTQALVGLIILIATLMLVILQLCGIALHPQIKIILSFAFILVSVINFFTVMKSRTIAIIIGVVLAASILVISFFGDPAIVNVTVDNTEYVCTYSKFTGFGETRVNYYKRHLLIFAESTPDFVENYGILLCGWDSVLDHEPYEVYYND